MSEISFLERVKIQAEILAPLFHQLEAELGQERACELIRAAVREQGLRIGAKAAARGEGSSLDKLKSVTAQFASNGELEIEPLENDDKRLWFNVRGCQYAAYFKSIGEPLLGAMLTCEVDPPLTEGIGGDLSLTRSQTILKGGSHCDFRWTLGES